MASSTWTSWGTRCDQPPPRILMILRCPLAEITLHSRLELTEAAERGGAVQANVRMSLRADRNLPLHALPHAMGKQPRWAHTEALCPRCSSTAHCAAPTAPQCERQQTPPPPRWRWCTNTLEYY
jgi:hypothetical protein